MTVKLEHDKSVCLLKILCNGWFGGKHLSIMPEIYFQGLFSRWSPMGVCTKWCFFFGSFSLKLSYSCMPNMTTIISSHNKKIISQDTATLTPTQQERTCTCRKKSECPLEGKCLQANVVYQAYVATETTNESYVGLATNFKDIQKSRDLIPTRKQKKRD